MVDRYADTPAPPEPTAALNGHASLCTQGCSAHAYHLDAGNIALPGSRVEAVAAEATKTA